MTVSGRRFLLISLGCADRAMEPATEEDCPAGLPYPIAEWKIVGTDTAFVSAGQLAKANSLYPTEARGASNLAGQVGDVRIARWR